jgi:hypothetical protein
VKAAEIMKSGNCPTPWGPTASLGRSVLLGRAATGFAGTAGLASTARSRVLWTRGRALGVFPGGEEGAAHRADGPTIVRQGPRGADGPANAAAAPAGARIVGFQRRVDRGGRRALRSNALVDAEIGKSGVGAGAPRRRRAIGGTIVETRLAHAPRDQTSHTPITWGLLGRRIAPAPRLLGGGRPKGDRKIPERTPSCPPGSAPQRARDGRVPPPPPGVGAHPGGGAPPADRAVGVFSVPSARGRGSHRL